MVDPSYWSLKISWTILLVFLDPRWSKAFEYLENSNYWFNSRSLLNLTDLLLTQWDVCAFYCFFPKDFSVAIFLWWYRTEAEARGKVFALMFGGCLLGGACCVWRRWWRFWVKKSAGPCSFEYCYIIMMNYQIEAIKKTRSGQREVDFSEDEPGELCLWYITIGVAVDLAE